MISDRISPHLVRITPGATSLCNRSGHMSQPARGRGAGGRQDTSGDLGTDRRKGPAAPPARAGPDTAPLNHIRMLHGAGRSWELQLKGQLLAGPLPSGPSSRLGAAREHCSACCRLRAVPRAMAKPQSAHVLDHWELLAVSQLGLSCTQQHRIEVLTAGTCPQHLLPCP